MTRLHVNGVSLEADLFGPPEGPVLLLIHGFGQQSIAWTDEWIAGFTRAGFRVITYDHRDTGLSQKWHGELPDFAAIAAAVRAGRVPELAYSLSDMTADAAGVLDAFGIDSAHILGASMGGMIAQLMALEHRAKVRSLTVIFSTTGDKDLPPSTREAQIALVSRPQAQDRASVIAHVLASRRAYASTGFALDDEKSGEHIGRCYDRMYYPEGSLRHWAAIVGARPRGDRLRRLSVPALVLHGAADALVPPAHGRRLAECIPGADYHEIEGWGHDVSPSLMPRLHGLIVPFLEAAEAGRK